MVISAGLKILYSFLYRKYINHIHLVNVLLLNEEKKNPAQELFGPLSLCLIAFICMNDYWKN
jgi:hypothetical protein